MKKLLLTLGVAFVALTGSAGEKILYQQNFENVTDPAEAGWSITAGSISIQQEGDNHYVYCDDMGENGRTAQVKWGNGIFYKDGESLLEDGTYTMTFDFNIVQGSNNQYGGAITVFTNHSPVNNQPFRTPWSPAGYWQNFIFDMTQVNASLSYVVDGGTIESEKDGKTTYSVDTSGAKSFTQNQWYTVVLNVNTNTREVAYTVTASNATTPFVEGTLIVPEENVASPDAGEISLLAEGVHALLARYQTKIAFDNFKIFCETADDVANEPTVTLSRIGTNADGTVNLDMRAYTITFVEGETLHIEGTDGETVDVTYASCNGNYIYETSTSGTLSAWTTLGNATSDKVEEEVECSPIALPEATASITGITEGFGKTYTFSANNDNVPLKPEISFSYVFTGKSGNKVEGTGDTVNVTEEGTLAITTLATGYQSTTANVENNTFYALKNEWDFARMSDEEITNAGFPEYSIQNTANNSGTDQWTGRKRLYYTNSGSTVYPFGWVSSTSSNVLYYSTIGSATNVAGKELFPGITVYAGHNVRYLKNIGMINDETTGGNDKNIDVLDLDENDLVVINKISGYGSDSNHPECASDEEYYAQLAGKDYFYDASAGKLDSETGKYTVSCPVYRIDTAATKVTVYSEVDLNADYTYTIQYVNEDDGKTIKEVEGTGKFGEAIELTEEQTSDFEYEGVKYIVVSNDAEGKTVTLAGTTITITCYAIADYKINCVFGEEVLQSTTKTGRVGSTIVLTKEETANIEKDGLTYVLDGTVPENVTISADGATVITLPYKILTADYTLKYVVGETVLKSETLSGAVGASIVLTEEEKAAIDVEGVTYVYVSDDAEGKTITVEGTTITLTYEKLVIPVTSLVILDEEDQPIEEGTVIEIHTGHEYNLTAVVGPENATNKTVTWTSSDPTIVDFLDEEGLLDGLKAGEATITASIGDLSVEVKVMVTDPTVPVTGVTLNETKYEMLTGSTFQLIATLAPEDATSKDVTWASSDKTIATVSTKGLVTALKAGTVTISATANKIKATCEITIKDPFIAVEGVTLDEIEIDGLIEGETVKLTATVTPENATDPTVTWTSSDEAVATVDEEGTVTAVAPGTATITATAGEVSAMCKITVVAKPIAVEGIILNESEVVIVEGAEFDLTYTINPENATDKTVTWTSSNEEVATVDATGKVKTLAAGEAIITATAGDKTAECKFIVKKAVAGVTISKTEATLKIGETLELTATIDPEDAIETEITWTSSDETIATVDENGKVTALAAGDVTITAAAGEKTASCKITVTKTSGIELIGFDSKSPIQVYDFNGRYVADKVEGLQAGYYIIRQGNNAKKIHVK